MDLWIIGVVVVIAWIVVLWIYARWSNGNFEWRRFEQQSEVIQRELSQMQAAGDPVALGKFLKALSRKWPRIGWIQQTYAAWLEQQEALSEATKVLHSYVRRVKGMEDEHHRAAADEVVMLVRTLHRAGRTAAAERLAEKRIVDPLAAPDLDLLYAEMAYDRGDDAEAMRRYTEAVERRPEDAAIAMRLVTELLARDRGADAELALRQAIRRNPRGEALAILYARLAHDRGDWLEAVDRWAAAREDFVFNVETYESAAEALRNLGRDADAVKVLASRPRAIGDLL